MASEGDVPEKGNLAGSCQDWTLGLQDIAASNLRVPHMVTTLGCLSGTELWEAFLSLGWRGMYGGDPLRGLHLSKGSVCGGWRRGAALA